MTRLRVHSIRGALACLSLLALLSVGDALAQSSPSTPATLRLAQVVVRLIDGLLNVHLYAIAQDESGKAVAPQPGALTALIGPNYVPVDLARQDGIGIVFLIDISASLSELQFGKIKDSVKGWIGQLGPNDRVAIVTLGDTVKTVHGFTTRNDPALISVLANLPQKPSDQHTKLYQGLIQAIDLSRRLDVTPLRRAIVVLTDGMDDQQGGAGRQEVLDKLDVDPTPIYGLGAAKRYDAKVDTALKDFSALVRKSGGDYRRINDINSPNKEYLELQHIVGFTNN